MRKAHRYETKKEGRENIFNLKKLSVWNGYSAPAQCWIMRGERIYEPLKKWAEEKLRLSLTALMKNRQKGLMYTRR